ncbi:PIN domain-containing protein [Tsukamurella soli]|uniref:PIN domain-containing protein n=1 Tax=Tsukamurella soli TaxID=644556 RepID=UPI0036172520
MPSALWRRTIPTRTRTIAGRATRSWTPTTDGLVGRHQRVVVGVPPGRAGRRARGSRTAYRFDQWGHRRHDRDDPAGVAAGFVPAAAQATIRTAFDILEFVEPTRQDYIEAATLGNRCRRAGVQLGSVDALIAQIAISGDHTLLTTDNDFRHAAVHVPLRLWQQST